MKDGEHGERFDEDAAGQKVAYWWKTVFTSFRVSAAIRRKDTTSIFPQYTPVDFCLPAFDSVRGFVCDIFRQQQRSTRNTVLVTLTVRDAMDSDEGPS